MRERAVCEREIRKVINRLRRATPPGSKYVILRRNVYLKCERCLKKKKIKIIVIIVIVEIIIIRSSVRGSRIAAIAYYIYVYLL